LVKGRTFKEKKETIETQVNEVSGNISEKRISTDVFVDVALFPPMSFYEIPLLL
jgi:hypothetical protein